MPENSVTKVDIVKKIVDQHDDWELPEIQKACDVVIDELCAAMERRDRIEIRGFGSFQVKERMERIARNPKTNLKVHVPAHVVPAFRAGKELKQKLNNET